MKTKEAQELGNRATGAAQTTRPLEAGTRVGLATVKAAEAVGARSEGAGVDGAMIEAAEGVEVEELREEVSTRA